MTKMLRFGKIYCKLGIKHSDQSEVLDYILIINKKTTQKIKFYSTNIKVLIIRYVNSHGINYWKLQWVNITYIDIGTDLTSKKK